MPIRLDDKTQDLSEQARIVRRWAKEHNMVLLTEMEFESYQPARPTCCAKVIERVLKYLDQSGNMHRVALKKGTLKEAREVLSRLEPDFEWIVA